MAKQFVPKWFGEVKDGKLHLIDQEKFKQHLRHFEGHAVELQVKRKYRKRSLDANAYLWVVYSLISEHSGHTPEEIHAICKAMFLKTTKTVLDRTYEAVGSTSGLDTFDFSQYVSKVKNWAVQELGIAVPDSEDYQR